MQEDRYVQTIRELLHKKRFDHSLNVAQRAVELAKRYGEDEQKAYIAGILHDICKNMQPEEQLQWMKKSAIILDENLLEQPPVWHGFAGAEYIRQQLGIEDEDIITEAVHHELERDYPDVERMRRLSDRSLREGMREALVFAVSNQAQRHAPLCLDTCKAYNEYLR